ncbi:InlB B-repeat-containing protein [Hominenteromicrobium sp.]|uniref:InlB B-repeat-containing protein n=1 Tax=Hominenteromicrobium sp. TaxID=3073581 RepID=UPI003A8F2DF1
MPLGGATFYQYKPSHDAWTQTGNYYVEVVPGETGTENVDGTSYKLDHKDTTDYYGWLRVTKEDQYAITGFTFNEKISTSVGDYYDKAKFYYTRNSYDITFINGGKTEKTESRKYQQNISNANYTPTNKPAGVPANFTFAGWYENELCKGTAYDFTDKTMPAKGITLYAKWQAPVIEAKVYLTASADGDFETIEVPYGTKLSDSEDFKALLEKLTEKPSAWIDSNGALFNVDTKLYGSVTISPFFPSAKDGFTVTYVEGENENVATDNQKYVSGSSARVLPPENSENFRAWKTEDGKLIHPGDKITVTKNITLEAVYTNKPQTETITYHYNFGDSTQTFIDSGYPKNTTATVRSRDYVGFTAPTGYKFLGWATTPNGNVEYQPNTKVFVDANGDNNLYAVWQVKTYTIKWVNWDDSEVRTDTEVPYGTELEVPANPTREADAEYTYTFAGWTPKIETVTGDATYKATYTKEANIYKVTYDLDGGEWENDTTYTYTKKYKEEVEVKADPTKEGYTFAGWTSAEVEVVNGKFTMPAKDVTLKAKWEANIYKVTYELNGGEWTEATNEFPYEYKATVEVIKTVPTREGYKFSGWRSEEVTIENDAFTMPAKDVVLKAVWEANPTPPPIPSEEPTPTPAPTEEPTPTPAPTEESTPTPAPTDESTPTPAPTEEPTPTPAPTE